MKLFGITMAVFALTASSTFAQTGDYSDDPKPFNGMRVTYVAINGDLNHVSGVSLNYLEDGRQKTFYHGNGQVAGSRVFVDGEYIESFGIIADDSGVKYLEFHTSKKKSVPAGKRSSEPVLHRAPSDCPNCQVGGFKGKIDGDTITSFDAIWVTTTDVV